MRRILLVDDEALQLGALKLVLERHFAGGDVLIEGFTDPAAAVFRAQEMPFAVIVSDYRMPGINGVQLLQRMRKLQPDAVRLMLTAATDFDTVMDALNDADVFRYVNKPFDDDLVATVDAALARHSGHTGPRKAADDRRRLLASLAAGKLDA